MSRSTPIKVIHRDVPALGVRPVLIYAMDGDPGLLVPFGDDETAQWLADVLNVVRDEDRPCLICGRVKTPVLWVAAIPSIYVCGACRGAVEIVKQLGIVIKAGEAPDGK